MKFVYFALFGLLLILLFGCTQNNQSSASNTVNLYFSNVDEGNVYLIKFDKQSSSVVVTELNNFEYGTQLDYVTFSKNHKAYGVDDGTLYIFDFSNSEKPNVKKFNVGPSFGTVYVDKNIFVLDYDMNLYIYNTNGKLIKEIKSVGSPLPICSTAFCLQPMVEVNNKLYVVNQKSEDHLTDDGSIWYYFLSVVNLNNYNVDKKVHKVTEISDFDYDMLSINYIDGNLFMGGVSSVGPLSIVSLSGDIIKSVDTKSSVEKIDKVGNNILVEEEQQCEVFTKSLQKVYEFKCSPNMLVTDGTYAYAITDKDGMFVLDVYNSTSLVSEVNLNINDDYSAYKLVLG